MHSHSLPGWVQMQDMSAGMSCDFQIVQTSPYILRLGLDSDCDAPDVIHAQPDQAPVWHSVLW